MKKVACFFLLLFFVFRAEAQTVFLKSYAAQWPAPPISSIYGAVSIVQLSDEGFAVLGLNGTSSMAILRTNMMGDTLWCKSYIIVPNYLTTACSFISTTDGGFLLNGMANTTSVFIKTDSLGNILWSKSLNPVYPIYQMKQLADSSYLLFRSGSLIRMSPSGNILSTTSFQFNAWAWDETADGGYIATGGNQSVNNNQGAWLTKIDSAENVTWCKTIFYAISPYTPAPGRFVHQTADGGYLFGGNYDTISSQIQRKPYLIKTNALGNVVWSKTYEIDYFKSSVYTTGGIVVCGSYLQKPVLLKMDDNGFVQWAKAYESDTGANSGSIGLVRTTDEGFAVVASNSYGIIIIKTDSLGNAGCNDLPINITTGSYFQSSAPYSPNIISVNYSTTFAPASQGNFITGTSLCPLTDVPEARHLAGIIVYPNPSPSDFTFEINSAIIPHETKLILFDCLGNKVREENITQQKTTISKSNLSVGIYFWQIISETGNLGSGKIIVQE